VHAVKSTSLGIGALHLSEMAKELEADGKEKNEGSIHAHHDEMMQEYEKILHSIQTAFGAEAPNEPLPKDEPARSPEPAASLKPAEEAGEDIEKRKLIDSLDKLEEQLESFESAAVEELLEELSGYTFRGQTMGEWLSPIGDKVREFDFLGASEALSALREEWEKER
jgi:hypothetical protein